MVNIIVELSKYAIIILMSIYTFSCFSIFAQNYEESENRVYIRQNVLMFFILFLAYAVMYLKTDEKKYVFFFGVQAVLFLAVILLYSLLYPNVSRLIVNNMCMLLGAGLIMITRLTFGNGVKQFIFVTLGAGFGLIVPVLIRKMKFLEGWTWIYAGVGFAALLLVALFAVTSGGAKLGFTIAGFGIQPSEFVKILFVFYVASSLKKSTEFKNVVITTIIAAAHVLILVLSTDLGAALILFVVYLVMLYVATRQPLYAAAGIGAGSAAAVVGYHLFSHIKVRVAVWKDPFASYSNGGYQVAQSLFAIGTGSWFGMGLFQGSPDMIPVAETDFIFSAIAEELGVIFALCLVLICVSCYVMFLNIAMEIRDRFYKLVALGLGTCYIFQVFLTIGGVTKFIPSTGVTLPLVSYGGSSLLSTMIMFGIIQGLYILREDEEELRERKRKRAFLEEQGRMRRQEEPGRRPGGREEAQRRNGSFEEPERRRTGREEQKRGRKNQEGFRKERAGNEEQQRPTRRKTTRKSTKFEEVPKQRIR